MLNSSLASECLSGRTWTTAENPSSGEVRCDHPATMFEVMIQTAKTEIFQPDVTFMSDLYTIQNPVVLASWDVTCSASQNYLYEAHIGAMNGDDSAEIMLLGEWGECAGLHHLLTFLLLLPRHIQRRWSNRQQSDVSKHSHRLRDQSRLL